MNQATRKVSDQRRVDQLILHVVVQRSTTQCAFENGFVFQICYFILGVGKICLDVGEVITKSLCIIWYAGYWVVAIDVLWVDAAGHWLVSL